MFYEVTLQGSVSGELLLLNAAGSYPADTGVDRKGSPWPALGSLGSNNSKNHGVLDVS